MVEVCVCRLDQEKQEECSVTFQKATAVEFFLVKDGFCLWYLLLLFGYCYAVSEWFLFQNMLIDRTIVLVWFFNWV